MSLLSKSAFYRFKNEIMRRHDFVCAACGCSAGATKLELRYLPTIEPDNPLRRFVPVCAGGCRRADAFGQHRSMSDYGNAKRSS